MILASTTTVSRRIVMDEVKITVEEVKRTWKEEFKKQSAIVAAQLCWGIVYGVIVGVGMFVVGKVMTNKANGLAEAAQTIIE